jgi:hypothetical protein
MEEMVVRHPPNADDYKTHYVGQEFRSHRQEAMRQTGGNVPASHLGHVNFQYKEGNNDGKDPVAECLDACGRHRTNSKKPAHSLKVLQTTAAHP